MNQLYVDIYRLAAEVQEPPDDVLAFARQLADVRQTISNNTHRCECGYGHTYEHSPTSSALVVLLDALTNGGGPTIAVAKAIHVYESISRMNRANDEARRERERATYEALMIEEETTRKVECPYCGAAAGASCRTATANQSVRTQSHRDRFRLAREMGPEPAAG